MSFITINKASKQKKYKDGKGSNCVLIRDLVVKLK